MKTSMYKALMVGLVACAAITLFADISLDGIPVKVMNNSDKTVVRRF